MDRLIDELQVVVGSAGAGIEGERDDPTPIATVRGECEWWDEAQSPMRELHSILGFGPITEGSLWRHPLLNREDRAPCEKDREDFAALLAKIIPLWERADSLAERVRLDEMAVFAREGGVREWIAPPVDEQAIERRARMVLAARERAGEVVAFDDILQEVRESGASAVPRESYARIDGRYYLHASFPDLSRSREYRDAHRMIAIECGSLIVAFFVQRGYTWWDEALERQLHLI